VIPRHRIGLALATTIALQFALKAEAQKDVVSEETAPLILTAQIPLPGVQGRFDHLAFDPKEPGRIFISALGNTSLEEINSVRGSRSASYFWYPGATRCGLARASKSENDFGLHSFQCRVPTGPGG
jgi:hypothetical protein